MSTFFSCSGLCTVSPHRHLECCCFMVFSMRKPYFCTRTRAAVQLSRAAANGATVKGESGRGGKGVGLVFLVLFPFRYGSSCQLDGRSNIPVQVEYIPHCNVLVGGWNTFLRHPSLRSFSVFFASRGLFWPLICKPDDHTYK